MKMTSSSSTGIITKEGVDISIAVAAAEKIVEMFKHLEERQNALEQRISQLESKEHLIEEK